MSFAQSMKATTRTDGEQSSDGPLEQWKALYELWKREINDLVVQFLAISINRQTLVETLRFISLVIVSMLAGSAQIVKYLGIFTIKLIERTTWLAHVLTPLFLGLFDLVSKIIGGFYIIIAMIWRDSVGQRRQPLNNAIKAGPPRQAYRAPIRYDIR